ncbi:hypothetical protein DVH05_010181 [Phytophthora capsici]|nr:hypothetical protein DVH05_010181 [Phytophthora capsici]
MIDVFTKSYGDEGLAKMLEVAKQVEGTKDMASNLQRAQVGQWMAQGKSPNDVLTNVLKVDSTAFLDDASGSIWRAYNKEYAKKFPEADFAFQP